MTGCDPTQLCVTAEVAGSAEVIGGDKATYRTEECGARHV